jgi:type I restriction enzyme S subunit
MKITEKPFSIPDHWRWIELKELAEVNPTFDRDDLSDNDPVSFVGMKRVEELSGRIDLSETQPLSEVRKGYTYFEDGDVLFAKITPCMENGKVAVARGLENGVGFGSTEFHVIRHSEETTQEWIFHYLIQEGFRRDAKRAMTGSAGQKRVPTGYIEEVPIPLPPLPEQRRIVAKIEELFSNLDAGMDDLQAAGQQLERYRLSVLQAAVEGRLTADWRRTHDPEPADQLHDRIRSEKKQLYDSGEIRKPKERPAPEEDEIPFNIPEEWSWIRITELMYSWRSGLEKRNSEQGPELQYPYIKMGDITDDGRLTLDSVTRVDAEPEDVEKYELSRGDFLFNVRNSKKLVGKSCVFDVESDETYLFNNNILRVDFGGKVSAKYINYWFCSAAGRDMLEELKSSTTNVAAIYHKDFFTCIVPLPPLDEQKQIVDEVERLLSVADDAAATAEREHTRAERLRQSILKQAFSGRLVPHDEDADPPAIEASSSNGTGQDSPGDTDASASDDSSDEEDVVAEDLYNGGDPGKQIEMDL